MALTTDQVLERIGGFGWYQIALNVFFNLMVSTWYAIPSLIMVFITAEPGWKCKENTTSCPFNESLRLGDNNYSFRCDIPREDWEFVDDFSSVVTEFDLVCRRGSFGFVSSSVMFVGFFVGSICVSPFADKFGRKRAIFISGFFMALFNFLSAFAPAYWVFALFRAIAGFMLGGFSIPMFVTATELAGIRYRSVAGVMIWCGFDLTSIILGGVAYLIKDWKTLTLVTGAPGFLIVLGWFCFPESVRWLLKRNREVDAREILIKVARTNGKVMPDEPLVLPDEEFQERLGDFRDLFSSRGMAHKTIVSWLLWFIASLVVWSIIFSAPFIGGSVYINVAILGAALLPSYPVTWFLLNRFGRKPSFVLSMMLAAGGAIGSLLLTDKAETDKGYLAGKIFMFMAFANFFSVIAFTIIYVYSAELFPTSVRNVGVGTSSAAARVGAILAVLTPLLLEVHRFLAFGIMAGVTLFAAMICLTLPETRGQPTLESFTEKKENVPMA